MDKNCPMRHENENCLPAGGFCTANKNICEALLNAYGMGKAQLSQEGTTKDATSELPTIQPEPQWISVTERLPDNADHPGAFCPRYQVVTPYGVTEGWYRPHDHEKGGQWFALFWFMSQIYEIWNIDFERGDVPKVIGEAPVMEWRPLPTPYKPNNK